MRMSKETTKWSLEMIHWKILIKKEVNAKCCSTFSINSYTHTSKRTTPTLINVTGSSATTTSSSAYTWALAQRKCWKSFRIELLIWWREIYMIFMEKRKRMKVNWSDGNCSIPCQISPSLLSSCQACPISFQMTLSTTANLIMTSVKCTWSRCTTSMVSAKSLALFLVRQLQPMSII